MANGDGDVCKQFGFAFLTLNWNLIFNQQDCANLVKTCPIFITLALQKYSCGIERDNGLWDCKTLTGCSLRSYSCRSRVSKGCLRCEAWPLIPNRLSNANSGLSVLRFIWLIPGQQRSGTTMRGRCRSCPKLPSSEFEIWPNMDWFGFIQIARDSWCRREIGSISGRRTWAFVSSPCYDVTWTFCVLGFARIKIFTLSHSHSKICFKISHITVSMPVIMSGEKMPIGSFRYIIEELFRRHRFCSVSIRYSKLWTRFASKMPMKTCREPGASNVMCACHISVIW